MANTIKQIGIKDSAGSGYDNRDIGAEAQNVEVSFNSQGGIIEDITEPGVVVAETKGVSEVAKDLQDQVDGKAPLEHEDEIASTSKLGHIKKGTGINIANDGTASVAYGSAAGTAAQGNDSRLSDARKNPNAVTFSDGKATPTTVAYDGSAAKTITYSNVGAAPTSHASSSTTYGVASDSNYGHVKIGTGLSVSNGVAAVNFITNSTDTDSNKAIPGSDTRLSNARTPKSHVAKGTTYGGATGTYYGHSKLSDTYDSLVSGGAAANGVAASQNALYNAYNELNNKLSHIGQIIHSTVLDTIEKVKAIYGENTEWIQLSGYVLRGATSGVTPNNNAKDLGSDNATLVSHSHTVNSHRHYVARQVLAESAGSHSHGFYSQGGGATGQGWVAQATNGYNPDQSLSTWLAGEHTHYISAHYTDYSAPGTDTQGSSATNANIPNEKNVYMWERIS